MDGYERNEERLSELLKALCFSNNVRHSSKNIILGKAAELALVTDSGKRIIGLGKEYLCDYASINLMNISLFNNKLRFGREYYEIASLYTSESGDWDLALDYLFRMAGQLLAKQGFMVYATDGTSTDVLTDSFDWHI